MYPSWGNYPGQYSQNYGGPGARKPPGVNPAGGFGGFEAPSSGSLFSSLQEQHLQQMQQLQMLHQKQLQSVLHHGNSAGAYGAGYTGSPWQPGGSGSVDNSGEAVQPFYKQETPTTTPPGQQQPPPPPPQPLQSEPQPPPPESVSSKPPENKNAPKLPDSDKNDQSATGEDKSLALQEQQQRWYKQHLQNLQKLKQEKAKQSQSSGSIMTQSPGLTGPPLPPPDSPKGKPPPPPPKDELPGPPPPPDETKSDVPQDSVEAARLQQLQVAAAQWQQVQQQRVGLQYQALMQHHEKLQKILEQYQQLIQQTVDTQSMSTEMQLRHYEMQQQHFTPLFQNWEHSFALWYGQFQTYPHKDQLKDYELQWKQWQEQMNATKAHLQERVTALTPMVQFPPGQYNSGTMGKYSQYPGHENRINQQPAVQNPVGALGPSSQGSQPPVFGPSSESSALPVRGNTPAGMADRPPGPPPCPPPSYNNVQGLSGNNPRFDQQQFDGPPRFDQPQQQSERPPRFHLPQHHFDGPPRFDQPPRFNGPPRFDQPPQRFDGPTRFNQPGQRFEGPPRFDQPRQRFDGPQRFEQPPFGQQSRHEQFQRHSGPPPNFEHPPVPQQKPQPSHQHKPEIETKQAASIDINTPGKPDVQLKPEKEKKNSGPDVKTGSDDLTNDNLLVNEGFFLQNDPIPQTAGANEKEKNSSADGVPDKSVTSKPPNSSSSTNAISSVKSLSSPVNKPVKPDDTETNKKPPAIGIPLEAQSPKKPVEIYLSPDPMRTGSGRGRGQPPGPAEMRGRGRGQRGHGDFRGNTMSHGKDTEETSYGYQPPEEDMVMSEEQQDYYWQDPSYEEYGCEESEEPTEEMWMPEDNYYPPEEEYYEESRGGPPMGRGGHPFMRGRPPMTRGGPPMMRGGHPSMRGSPQMIRGGISMMRGGPPMARGGPPMPRGGPPMPRGGPPMPRGGPPMPRGGPPMPRGGLLMARGGPPMGRGGPSIGRGGLPMGRGEPHDMHWEDPQSSEYYEQNETYWEEVRPPVRGMRPPFPPGQRRPPPGHPAFMRGRGRPPHPLHGPVDHGLMEHQYSGNIETDPEGHPVHDPHSLPMHPDVAGGRRRIPPPPHEIIETMDEQFYNDETKREWQPPHGRGHPPPPPNRGGIRRRPVGREMARGGLWRPGPEHEAFKEGYREGFVDDFSHGEDGYRHRPPLDYPPDGYHRDPEHYDRERGYALPERDFPHRPPEAYGDGPWREEREKDHPYPYDERDRERAELRIREYRDEPPYPPSAQPSEWDRPTRHAPLPERDYEDGRPCYEHRGEPPLDKLQSFPLTPGTNLPESSVEKSQGTNSGNVLALSQRQHEIILKAAQELKLIREMQEGKTPGPEPQPSKTLPELPAGLLGLEIPQDVRNVLKGMSAAAVQTPTAEPASWDLKPPLKDYSSTVQAPPTVIPKTLDYAHGHESGTTVERISYGERIVLRPDPVPSDRGYEKEALRDPYSRDPYYERRGDPYMERREYSRERELYREKLPPDYERERFDRERYPPREREDRPPLRPGYREREWDSRDRDRSGSRDRIDDPYRRPGYDRPPYERSGLDRSAPERYPHTSSPLMDRRSYHEDRGPAIPPPLPPPPQPAPRVEKKPEIKNIDDILKQPGRQSRPERIVIILRGLPGSGKSHVAKLIRDKEVECGGAPPRVLVLDDYFMTEVEKVEKDPDTGRRIKTKVLEYEYEPEMEDTYRNSMLKTFKKTLDDGFFPFIILDSVNDRVKHFDQFWSAAKTKGFEVYLAEMTADTQTCAKRNVHGRTLKEITKMSSSWEPSPRHMVRLDVRSLLQDAAIEEVEMEDFNPDEELAEPKKEEEEESDLGYIPKSKWEMDTSEAKLDKLDGLGSSGKRKRDGDMADLEDYLQLPDDYATRLSQPGKKRVRWADLEEQKDADRKRAIGFVVGQTDWERITDESGKLAQRALNRTKYF